MRCRRQSSGGNLSGKMFHSGRKNIHAKHWQRNGIGRLDNDLFTAAERKNRQPLIISGKARGNWFFEASFPVKLVDENGNELANGTAAAQSDWMTEDFVEFLATFEFTAPPTTAGTLILQKDNPSGLSEHNNQLIVPVEFE